MATSLDEGVSFASPVSTRATNSPTGRVSRMTGVSWGGSGVSEERRSRLAS